MQDFVAIDFETANGRRASVCSVGIVIVRGGVIGGRVFRLVQPVPNYFTYLVSLDTLTWLRKVVCSGSVAFLV